MTGPSAAASRSASLMAAATQVAPVPASSGRSVPASPPPATDATGATVAAQAEGERAPVGDDDDGRRVRVGHAPRR